MKSQFIEVKVHMEIITEEEISYTEAEKLALSEVNAALYNRYNTIVERTEHTAPPFFNFEVTS